jgi:hypothetical protein
MALQGHLPTLAHEDRANINIRISATARAKLRVRIQPHGVKRDLRDGHQVES